MWPPVRGKSWGILKPYCIYPAQQVLVPSSILFSICGLYCSKTGRNRLVHGRWAWTMQGKRYFSFCIEVSSSCGWIGLCFGPITTELHEDIGYMHGSARRHQQKFDSSCQSLNSAAVPAGKEPHFIWSYLDLRSPLLTTYGPTTKLSPFSFTCKACVSTSGFLGTWGDNVHSLEKHV